MVRSIKIIWLSVLCWYKINLYLAQINFFCKLTILSFLTSFHFLRYLLFNNLMFNLYCSIKKFCLKNLTSSRIRTPCVNICSRELGPLDYAFFLFSIILFVNLQIFICIILNGIITALVRKTLSKTKVII